MIKNLKIFYLSLLTFFMLSAPVVLAQSTSKRPTDKDCGNFYDWFNVKPGKEETSSIKDLPIFCSAQDLIFRGIELALAFAGSIAVIFLIVGGFRYITSAGNEEASEKGKKTIVTSLIGLAVIVLSGVLVRVLASTLGAG